jgi:hypothetical protein
VIGLGIRSGIVTAPTTVIDAILLARLLPVPVALEHASSTTDGTGFATGSKTPGAGRLQLLAVESAHSTAAEAPLTVTGCGLTWTKVTDLQNGTAATRRLSLWRARGPAPTAGALTITFNTSHLSVGWGWVEVPDVAGATDAEAIKQSQTATTSGGAATTLNCTLAAALEHANNVHIAMVGLSIQTTVTPDADFTELGDDNEATGALTIETEWARNQLACDPSWASANAAMIDVEVRAG